MATSLADLFARMRRELPMHDRVMAECVERIEQRAAELRPRLASTSLQVWHELLPVILSRLLPPEHCAAALACKLWSTIVRTLWVHATHITWGGGWLARVTRFRRDNWAAIKAAAFAGLASRLRTASALRVLDLRLTRRRMRFGYYDDDPRDGAPCLAASGTRFTCGNW